MNKFLLAITLLLAVFTVSSTALQAVDGDDIKNATKNGVKALNDTAHDLKNKTQQYESKIKDFFDISDDSTGEKIAKYALVVAIAAIGIFVGTHGYKFVKHVVVVLGFGFGGVFFSALFSTFFENSKAVPIIAFIVGGLALAAFCYYFYRVGVIVAGGALGMSLGKAIGSAAGVSHTVLIIIIVVLAIVGAVLVMYLEKPVLIIATASVGADMLVRSIGFFAQNYPNGFDFDKLSDNEKKVAIIYAAASILVWIIFILVQFYYTAVGINHGLGKDDQKDAKKAAAATAGAKPNAQKPINMV
ncbi:hypothetical protein LEN26_017364 [Aphanomyces euteiches]|nr:hypothetical protein LEN26_017364 [Aphanomyces euteiches]KAH9189176.1 hypothetical protein AeNC1_008856 [Aphanomyces euteiches]